MPNFEEGLLKVAKLVDGSSLKKFGSFSMFLKGLGNASKNIGKSSLEYVGNGVSDVVGNGIFGRQAMTGVRQIASSLKGGGLRQGRFNAGLKNLGAGVGKTGLTWGVPIYAGSQMLGSSEPAGGNPQPAPYYYG
jgi:hypothetical protein